MPARLTLPALALLCAMNANGQEVVRFDTVHFNQVGSFADGVSVFETDPGYRVFSIQKGLADMSQDIYVTDFDAGGGLVSERTFATYRQDDIGTSSPLVRTIDGYYGGVTRFGVNSPLDSLFLYKFDGLGDTLWTRFVAVDTSYTMRGTAVTAGGDILLTGLHYPPREAYVFRLDSLGTVKAYHSYADFEAEDVVEGRDGSWYVCGIGDDVGTTLHRPYLVRTDTAGSVQWSRMLEQNGGYYNLVALQDHGVVALGSHRLPADTSWSLAVKYDTAGTEVWRKQVLQADDEDRPSRFHAGFECADSSLVFCGWTRRSDVLNKGTVVKMDQHGNMLWSRFYGHYPTLSISVDNIFWDVKPTSDGGMVLTGETNSDDYLYGQLWLLKLDSAGCLVPGCGSVGVQEYTDLFHGQLRLSPNPASGPLRATLALPAAYPMVGTPVLVVVDAQGRIVLRGPAQQQGTTIMGQLDTQGLAPGTYYVHLADAQRWLAGGKVMVR